MNKAKIDNGHQLYSSCVVDKPAATAILLVLVLIVLLGLLVQVPAQIRTMHFISTCLHQELVRPTI